jgi:hypothetical protein
MLTGKIPFGESEDKISTIKKILKGKVSFPDYLSKASIDLIKRLLKVNKMKRLGNLIGGIEDIKNHKFYDNVNREEIIKRGEKTPFNINYKEGETIYFLSYYPKDIKDVSISTEEQKLFIDF